MIIINQLSVCLLFSLSRTKKPTAATRCMCPLYDIDRRGWIELQPMSVARLSHGVVAAGQFGFKRLLKKKKKSLGLPQ